MMDKLKCPVCHNEMNHVGDGIFECAACAGRWYLLKTFRDRLEEKLAAASSRHVTTRDAFELVRQCPECKIPMRKKVYEELDLVLDFCAIHGVFLDCDELGKILEFGQQAATTEVPDEQEIEVPSTRQYILRQRLFSFNGNYVVTDAVGHPVLKVAPDHERSIELLNLDDHAVARIIEAHGVFSVYRADSVIATIKGTVAAGRRLAFTIDVPGPDDIIAHGDLKACEFELWKGREEVASITKDMSGLKSRIQDSYIISVSPVGDPLLVICFCIVIDLLHH